MVIFSLMVSECLEYSMTFKYIIQTCLSNQFIFIMILKIIILSFHFLTLASAYCPQQCSCTTPDIRCQRCLVQYSRTYSQAARDCICQQYFIQRIPAADYCCPQFCAICYSQGCYTCNIFWKKVWVAEYQIYNCTCLDNYQFDEISQDCVCKSISLGTVYYSARPEQCLRCPSGCLCSNNQCLNCSASANRIIKLNIYQKHTCFCSNNLIQINGVCISIPNSVPDYVGNQAFNCISNYTKNLQNNSCECIQPYVLNANGTSCLCKSLLSYPGYYMFENICYICPSLCICSNEGGCLSCDYTFPRQIILFNGISNCTCYTPQVEINQVCQIIPPYDPNGPTEGVCLNLQYPNIFYEDIGLSTCNVCPTECVCNQSGCAECEISANRNVINGTCYCQNLTIEFNGICVVCQLPFVMIQNSCVCLSNFNPSVYYFDVDTNNCVLCPINCICTLDGCISCDNTTHRIISQNKQGKNICYCDSSSFEDNGTYCVCFSNFIYNSSSQSCQCLQPYTLNNSTPPNCICKNSINPNSYIAFPNCNPCPINCTCNNLGCILCQSSTYRTIEFYENNYMMCPCDASYQEINGICVAVYCLSSQYFWQNRCVNCPQSCLTCQFYGCTTCYPGTTIYNNKCVCNINDPLLTRSSNGNCICEAGYYIVYPSANNTCQSCPNYCYRCQYSPLGYINQYPNLICTVCLNNSYRIMNIYKNCPCIQFYIEGILTSKPYCCHWACLDCNISGCLSCLAFSNRQLNYTNQSNITCSCKLGFIQTYLTNCQCPSLYYEQNNQCFPCPLYCQNCTFTLYGLFNCTSCRIATNRILTVHYFYGILFTICYCVNGYEQSNPLNEYCTPQYCAQPTPNCTQCISPRVPNFNNSACLCSNGTYEDVSSNCQSCSTGCLLCQSEFLCTQCDQSQGYYLVQTFNTLCNSPFTTGFILFQSSAGVYMVIDASSTPSNSIKVQNATIIPIVSFSADSIPQTEELSGIITQYINSTWLGVVFNNPHHNYLNYIIINVSLQFNGSKDIYSFTFLFNHRIYSQATMNACEPYIAPIFTVVELIVFCALIIYIKGYKHNQIVWFIQTIYLMSFSIPDPNMSLAPYLFCLRSSIYEFGIAFSNSAFSSIVPDWNLYAQTTASGNFQYLTRDSNLFRNAGLPINIAIIFGVIIFVLRALFYKSMRPQSDLPKHKINKYKKIIYRINQFIYKTTMYPVIYFSLATIINYNHQQINAPVYFYSICLTTAILMLTSYILVTVYQCKYQEISKTGKYEDLLQFSFNFLCSVIMLITFGNSVMLIMALMCLLRGVIQIMIRKHFAEKQKFQKHTYFLLGIIPFQILVVFLIYFNVHILIVSIIFGFNVVLLICQNILVLWRKDHNYKYEKKTNQVHNVQIQSQNPSHIQIIQ